jgi:hypothetical protein
MSKTLTKEEVREKKFRRINDKSLRQFLIHRFINAYGYDKGEVRKPSEAPGVGRSGSSQQKR